MDANEASGSLAVGPPVSTAARAPYRRHTLFGTTVSEAHELTLEMGGAGGEFSPPLEAPQGAGHQLTAAAVPLENHINWSPL